MDIFPAEDRLDVLDIPAVEEDPDELFRFLFSGKGKDLPERPDEILPQGILDTGNSGIPAPGLDNIVAVGRFLKLPDQGVEVRLENQVVERAVVQQAALHPPHPGIDVPPVHINHRRVWRGSRVSCAPAPVQAGTRLYWR